VTHPTVKWTLEQVASVVDSVAADYTLANDNDVIVRRIDRTNNRFYDGSGTLDMSTPIHQRAGALERGVYIGAAYTDRSDEPIGTEYDHELETVVGVRIEGAHVSEWGAIDPQKGTANAASRDYPTTSWDTLVSTIRRAILTEREFPDPGRANVGYKDLKIANEADSSSDYTDYYRYDFDVRFLGFETLP